MKKYKYILLLVGLSIVGCTDLVEKPLGTLSPDGFFQSSQDLQTAIEGSKTAAINEKFWGRKLSIALMLRSDMVNLQSTQERRVEMDELTTLPTNGMISEYWIKSYQGITAANFAIKGAESLTDANKDEVVAQAYFMRAFYYFHLVRQFGAIPYLTEPVSDIDESLKISSTPASDVYAGIISDLEFAEANLPATTNAASIPSSGAASSYLALVYLTRAGNTPNSPDFTTALTYAEKVINSGNYSLDTNFQNLFNADAIDASPEPIFALDYNGVEASDNAYDQIAPMAGIRGDDRNDGGGWSVAVPTEAVFASFDPLDYRTEVSFDQEANIGGVFVDYTNFTISGHEHARNTPYIAKYARYPGFFARGSGRATSHNYSMMRYAELLLIAAEAAVEIGDAASATGYVNQVRARARLGGDYKTGADVAMTFAPSAVPADLTTVTVDDVIEERRIELAFECKRWYTIARRQLGDQVFSAAGYEGAKAGWDASVDYLMPIPNTEIEANPNLSQNPY